MKFKELKDEEIQKAKEIYLNKELSWDDRMILLMKLFGKSERTVRKWCSEKLGFKEKVEVEPEQYIKAKAKVHDGTKKRFIISWAQNNTPVHKKLLKNMEAYADFINADVHIIAGRYKNPTSVWTTNQESEEFWAEEVVKYLDANRHDIHKYVSILSDIKIQPTAVNPMTGMQALSGINSCVFGSPRVQLEMIPVLEGCRPKMMLTTGAITKKNYTDSKAGKVGDFHHTFGFVIVEIKDENISHIRQVTADDKTGNFSDLYYKVTEEGVSRIDSIAAAVLGDIHFGHHDQVILDTTFDMLKKIVPEHVIIHDVYDGNSISHWELKDPFLQYGKEINGTNNLGNEIEMMLDGLAPFQIFKKVVIDRSNHDDFLDRWLKNEDWKKQPTFKNSRLYMKYSDMLLEQYENDPYNVKGIIPAIINDKYPQFITLGRNSSYIVKGWELGQHGDIGSSGSKGSILQFRKLNTKIVVGHYHKPERKDGALSVGTSTHLRVGYNKGASPWLQSHVIIHNDGRAQHINFTNGEYTTFE